MLVPIIPYYNLRNTNTQVQVGAVCTLLQGHTLQDKKKNCFGNNYKKRNRNVGWGIPELLQSAVCMVMVEMMRNICIYYTCQYLRYTNTKRKTNTKEKRIKKRKKNENTIL